jgi:hypothetical protein
MSAPIPSKSPITDDAFDAYNRGACGTNYIRFKMQDMEVEQARLQGVIDRAKARFGSEGSDGAIASEMFLILCEK